MNTHVKTLTPELLHKMDAYWRALMCRKSYPREQSSIRRKQQLTRRYDTVGEQFLRISVCQSVKSCQN